MKKIKLILFFLIISLNLFCQTDSSRIKLINIPKTYTDVYEINPSVKTVNGELYNGIDTFSVLLGNEKILVIEAYKDGFKTELKTFFDNGYPEVHWQWKNRERDGINKRWYKSGKIMFDYVMQYGHGIGTNIMFYENGNPQSISDEKSGISVYFHENGKMAELTKKIKDSIKCGGTDGRETTEWRESGQLKSKSIDNCGKQSFKWYYNDTVIFAEGTQIGMPLFMVGKYTEYYKNGIIKMEKHYQDGNTQSEANIKTGTWKYWNEKGKLIREEYYENNELKKVKEYIKEKKPVKVDRINN